MNLNSPSCWQVLSFHQRAAKLIVFALICKYNTGGNSVFEKQTFSFKSCFSGVQELLTPESWFSAVLFSFIFEADVVFSFALKLFVLAYALEVKSMVLTDMSNNILLQNSMKIHSKKSIVAKLQSNVVLSKKTADTNSVCDWWLRQHNDFSKDSKLFCFWNYISYHFKVKRYHNFIQGNWHEFSVNWKL